MNTDKLEKTIETQGRTFSIGRVPMEGVPYKKPERRLGRFSISGDFVRCSWENLLGVFAHVVVIRCEHMALSDYFEYVGYSKLFEILEEGVAPPKYEFVLSRNSEGEITVTVCREIEDVEDID